MRALLLVWLASTALGLSACQRAEPKPDDCAPSERVVDPVLLAFLSQARSAHHVADQREAGGDVAGALKPLQALSQGPRPPGGAPEVSEVLADTQARVADLLSRTGEFDEASRAVDQGLALAREPSYFRGHLFEVRGLLEERREKALRGQAQLSGDQAAAADQARQRSLSAYEEAMKIQAAVIQAAPVPPSK